MFHIIQTLDIENECLDYKMVEIITEDDDVVFTGSMEECLKQLALIEVSEDPTMQMQYMYHEFDAISWFD